MNNMPS